MKRGEEVMKCIQLCQELETSEEKTNKIPVLNTFKNNEVVIQIYIINQNFIQQSCFGTYVYNNIQRNNFILNRSLFQKLLTFIFILSISYSHNIDSL